MNKSNFPSASALPSTTARREHGCTIGLDMGSVSVKYVVVDSTGAVLASRYTPHKGKPLQTAKSLLLEALCAYPEARLAVTGSTSKALCEALGVSRVGELSAVAAAAGLLFPHVRSIIEMGGEDAKLIIMRDGKVADFAVNSVCAAGTGSFLDQQAERLNLSIEELGRLAVESDSPAPIAGRCSVFAKSDLIHRQQIGTSVPDMVAGLCRAVAANFKGSIARGRSIDPPVLFAGGTALNAGLVKSFREVCDLQDEGALLLPDDPRLTTALGTALLGMRQDATIPLRADMLATLGETSSQGIASKARLQRPKNAAFSDAVSYRDSKAEKHYLGVDVGSISTNLVLANEEGRILAKRYLRTSGRPVNAVQQGLKEIAAERGTAVEIAGVGTTGSGRYMIADFIGADIVKNEITAQARAAVHFDPDVDTVFEIGGQDSKYIHLEDGMVVDFTMNTACAAGTGSFLEEQAERLGVAVKSEFQERAFCAESPCSLGERCTVFMENSLRARLSQGAGEDDLLAGLAHSVVENYLGKVVEDRPVGKKLFFQGGTAFNHAVTAAFEARLGRPVLVPPHHDVTGALGMALIARDHMREDDKASAFKGFGTAESRCALSSFTCEACENRCRINTLKIEGESDASHYGGRCGKFDVRKGGDATAPIEDLFAYRTGLLTQAHERYSAEHAAGRKNAPLGRIGLPFVFFMHDYLPYYATLLWELGFEPMLHTETDAEVRRLGLEAVATETCFPIKTALGHTARLIRDGMESIFLPSFINTSSDGLDNLACPLTQSFPYQARSIFQDARFLVPPVSYRFPVKEQDALMLQALQPFGVRLGDIRRAKEAARIEQERFRASIAEKGREVLASLDGPAVVVVGRAYNAFDPGMNLNIPRKLAGMGIAALPMDFLPAEEAHAGSTENMYWRSGRSMLSAMRHIAETDFLYPVVVGNFLCGPDSFIHPMLKDALGRKPALFLEIDEHSADAGIITRLEAFLDGVENQQKSGGKAKQTHSARPEAVAVSSLGNGAKRRVYVPHMSDHAYAMAAAFRYCGVESEVLPESDASSTAEALAHVSGKECYPFAVTTGDMLKAACSDDFEADRSAFFMPGGSGPCRFGQYNTAQRRILDKVGHGNVPLYSPMQDVGFYDELGIVGKDFSIKAWEGIAAYDILSKLAQAYRPHAQHPAEADALYEEFCRRLNDELPKGPKTADPIVTEAARAFAALPQAKERRPLIGIVGEIFVRANRFSNEDIIGKVEALGGEAWLAPVAEWPLYVNEISMREAKRHKQYRSLLKVTLTDFFQRRISRRLEKRVDVPLHSLHEPAIKATLRTAAPYLHSSFRGEAVLSVGTALDMIERGAHGIINAVPFGCMPGTVTSAILRRISQETGVPSVTIAYDGTPQPGNELLLETFMEQTKARM